MLKDGKIKHSLEIEREVGDEYSAERDCDQ